MGITRFLWIWFCRDCALFSSGNKCPFLLVYLTITHSSFVYLYNFSKPKVVIIGHSYFMLIMLCQIHLQSWFGGFMIWNYSVELIPIWEIPTLNYLGEEKVFRRYIFQHVEKNSNNAHSWWVYLSCRKRTQSSFQAWQVHFPTDSTFSHSAFNFRYNEITMTVLYSFVFICEWIDIYIRSSVPFLDWRN